MGQGLEEQFDVVTLLGGLAQLRPAFHSEADFQHAFAQQILARHPAWKVRLERPIRALGNAAVDVWVGTPTSTVAVELKYLTKSASGEASGEAFHLRNHGAHDVRRYDVLKDVSRMERMRDTEVERALVIALTNDPAYWTGPKRDDTNDAAFSLREGRVASGELCWSSATGSGTMKNREAPLVLRGSYRLRWQDYAEETVEFGRFRFLLIECLVD
mgnify:CR=1 FL=1|tara:strand:+ start:4493 stop:5137 length:645 start_codon:yes stop_codon:yes gene_type:complete